MPNPDPSATEAAAPVTGDLRAQLVGLIRQPFDGPVSTPTVAYAEAVADAILAAGYRRVSEDDDTIATVADAIDEDVRSRWQGRPDEFLSSPNDWRDVARAAVRALREGQ